MDIEKLSKVIEKEFAFLQNKYGFDSLITRNNGREICFDFERNAETISISLELGGTPIVEVFVPSAKINEKPTPWAIKDGIQRSRLFPKLDINKKYESENTKSIQEYFGAMASELEVSESGWLNA